MYDTIAAIATAGAVSAIGIIRLSGDDAIDIVSRVFKPDGMESMLDAENRKLHIGRLSDADGEIIDRCLCTVSRAPGSYTGENTAELQCHGSPVVLRRALDALFKAGARQARAGEFTKRAFLNGRMDLTQAEAVIDLIEAETDAAAINAAGQLGRAISRKTDAVYSGLVDIISHFHAVIDYPDEDIDTFELQNYLDVLTRAERTLASLLDTFERGRIMKDGVKCAIIGRPNAGKSSLLNALVGYDRAIVTDIAGTTRDVIEERIRIGGIVLRLADTAGMRDTEDVVERIGVLRAEETARESELVIAVFDGGEPLSDEDRRVLIEAEKAEKSIAAVNKSDLKQVIDLDEIRRSVNDVCVISAETGEGIDTLCAVIKREFDGGIPAAAGEILTNARQAECVSRAVSGIRDARAAMERGVTPDAVLTCVEDAISALGELTGRTMREDVVSRIFERFCVGK
ncbi:MAG: tRNA uridine-5-carboxymethylaminomethyl(34) synthesis GTPase MnmE [Oscillospiraceae bacterium]|nr:tRNA uridine-5-carboxymethylaminomethyl(34) synthesis GTPase MnmE [Oscillospiraceae bacterium]